MSVVFLVVLVAFVAFVAWRKYSNKNSTKSGADNYTPPDNRDVDQNPGN
jgi:hypothetical protein